MAKKTSDIAAAMIGKKAPAFTAITDTGEKVKLSDFKGKKVILFFYPKDNTPSFGLTHKLCIAA